MPDEPVTKGQSEGGGREPPSADPVVAFAQRLLEEILTHQDLQQQRLTRIDAKMAQLKTLSGSEKWKLMEELSEVRGAAGAFRIASGSIERAATAHLQGVIESAFADLAGIFDAKREG